MKEILCPKCGNHILKSMHIKVEYNTTYYEYYCKDCDTYFILKDKGRFVRFGKIGFDLV